MYLVHSPIFCCYHAIFGHDVIILLLSQIYVQILLFRFLTNWISYFLEFIEDLKRSSVTLEFDA